MPQTRILGLPRRALTQLRAAPMQAVLSLWIALFVAVGIKNLLYPDVHNVYPCFEDSARRWLAGADLYDPDTTASAFRYAPVCAFSILPLALLPRALGSLIWIWLNFALFFAALWRFVQRGLPVAWNARQQAVFLSLVLLGTVRTLWSGQTNLLIFSLVALATLAIQEQHWWRAAFLLAMPVHLKVWPIVPAMLLIATWPRRLAIRFSAAMFAIAAIPFLAKPWDWMWRQYIGWYGLLTGPAQVRHTYRDAWTLWEVIHSPVHPQAYLFLQLLSGAVVLGLCLWQVRRGLSVQRHLLFVLVSWTAWQMTFGPATERTTFGLIAPLSSWGVVAAFQQRRDRILMGLAFVLMAAANFGGIERAFMEQAPIVLAAHPVGAILFYAWFLRWNDGTTDSRKESSLATVSAESASRRVLCGTPS